MADTELRLYYGSGLPNEEGYGEPHAWVQVGRKIYDQTFIEECADGLGMIVEDLDRDYLRGALQPGAKHAERMWNWIDAHYGAQDRTQPLSERVEWGLMADMTFATCSYEMALEMFRQIREQDEPEIMGYSLAKVQEGFRASLKERGVETDADFKRYYDEIISMRQAWPSPEEKNYGPAYDRDAELSPRYAAVTFFHGARQQAETVCRDLDVLEDLLPHVACPKGIGLETIGAWSYFEKDGESLYISELTPEVVEKIKEGGWSLVPDPTYEYASSMCAVIPVPQEKAEAMVAALNGLIEEGGLYNGYAAVETSAKDGMNCLGPGLLALEVLVGGREQLIAFLADNGMKTSLNVHEKISNDAVIDAWAGAKEVTIGEYTAQVTDLRDLHGQQFEWVPGVGRVAHNPFTHEDLAAYRQELEEREVGPYRTGTIREHGVLWWKDFIEQEAKSYFQLSEGRIGRLTTAISAALDGGSLEALPLEALLKAEGLVRQRSDGRGEAEQATAFEHAIMTALREAVDGIAPEHLESAVKGALDHVFREKAHEMATEDAELLKASHGKGIDRLPDAKLVERAEAEVARTPALASGL